MRYTPDAEALADLLNGTWQRLPSADWTLSHLYSVGKAAKSNSAKPGTLAYTSRSTKSLRKLQHTGKGKDSIAILTDGDLDSDNTELPILRVADLTASLNRLGRESRKNYRGPVIAITGSAGKTTTRSMIRHVLSPQFSIFSAKGNYLSAIRSGSFEIDAEDIGLFEVARVSLPGAEQFLSPDIVVITSIAEAHMEDLGTLEEIAKTKSILLEGLGDSGTAIINIDTPYSDVLVDKARSHAGRIITYGEAKDADFRLVSYDYASREVTVALPDEKLTYTLGSAGKHNALNSISVLAVLSTLQLKLDDYLKHFETITPVSGRGDTSELVLNDRTVTLINEAYNANPASMKAALEGFAQTYPDRRRILVLGDMAELGPSAPDLHHNLVETVLAVAPAKVFLVGPMMGYIWKELPHEIQAIHSIGPAPVATFLPDHVQDGDAILVKASNSTGLAEVVKTWRSAQEPHHESLRIIIFGDVQQVGYRNWAVEHAQRRGVSGWVRNRSDGRVEALIQGPPQQLGRLLHDLHHGPPRARVSRISTRSVDVIPQQGFRLRRTRTLG